MAAPGATDPGDPPDEPPDSDGFEGTGPHSVRVPPKVDTDPPPTPRSSIEEVDVVISTPGRPRERTLPSSGVGAGADPDTLISAPRPAEREDLEVGERFRLLEDRVDELEARVRLLERPRASNAEARPQPWWIWLIFLLGLAFTWRLLEALR